MIKPLSRRTFLRGAGATLALPLLDAMIPTRAMAASGSVRPPVRMGIFTVSGGTVLESFKPESAGPLGELPSILRPLQPYKDDLVIVSGLSQNGKTTGKFNGHTSCAALHLTCVAEAKEEGGKYILGPSLDQLAAQQVGKESFLPSLEIGQGRGETKFSYAAADEPVPYEGNPKMVFDRMFRGRQPTVPNWAPAGSVAAAPAAKSQSKPPSVNEDAEPDGLSKSVLDLVLGEAQSLRRRLGAGDRDRLEQYMESVRSVEKRIAILDLQQSELTAELPTAQPVSDHHGGLIIPEISEDQWSDDRPISKDPEFHAEYIRAMIDLMVLGFQTDTTRVITFAVGQEGFLFPGVITVGFERHYHTIQHNGNARTIEEADPIAREGCRQVNAWYAGFFGELIGRMKAIDEGGTSLLDNSMMLYTSYMANGGHQKHNYPTLLAGSAGGQFKTGQHIECEARTPVANLYIEMLNAMGADVTEFGESHSSEHSRYDGRIPGLT